MAKTSLPQLFRIAGSTGTGGTTTEYELQLPIILSGAQSYWYLVSFHLVRTAGTASNWAPALGQAAGWTGADINERLSYSAAAHATPINDVFAQPIPCRTDSAGKVHVRIGWVGGSSDNEANFEFFFQRAR